ncbi:MAG: hypothetical protein NTZ59_03325 [Bacteroidetes bacterium]|nr:hypothetical protein [Bacteroidota bacterium]
MQKIKHGKEEIIYLLSRVIEKYKLESGQDIVLNTNRKNYEVFAILLSDISNQLPDKWEEFGTDCYLPDNNRKVQEYPYRKYDITGGQIKDALTGIVSNPRHFLVDSCYIYLYGIGRKAFEKNPVDENLLIKSLEEKKEQEIVVENNRTNYEQQILTLQQQQKSKSNKLKIVGGIAAIFCISSILLCLNLIHTRKDWQTIKTEMNILPYQPTKAEIDSLEGVWLCYTGSPQARVSDPNRYHKVVSNLIDITYKNGYFTFNRYGASFNHTGYMQFESPGIVSVFSRIKNNSNKTESPRHSLFNLYANNKFISAVSSSWNFDVGEKNRIIGLREIYIKQGKGGSIEEIINEVENASCNCKVIRWHQANNQNKSFYLKNEILDSLQNTGLKNLINEKSILLNIPQDGLIINGDSTKN